MPLKNFGFYAILALTVGFAAGCKKSAPEQTPPPPTQASPIEKGDSRARIHWLGSREIERQTNATTFLSVWKLPESRMIQTQLVERLALALTGQTPLTNPAYSPRVSATNTPVQARFLVPDGTPAAALRPLFTDAIENESYLEISGTAAQPEVLLAVRIDGQRSLLWETNLLQAFAATSVGNAPADADTLMNRQLTNATEKLPLGFGSLQLARSGGWTLLGLAGETNRFVGEALSRIKRDKAPYLARTNNAWLEADFDAGRALKLLMPDLAVTNATRMSVAVTGEADGVRTAGKLDFASPLGLDLTPWKVPTNLIHDPMVSFTAIRGIGPIVSEWQCWKDLQLGPAPNQVFIWGQDTYPFQTCFAASLPNASNQVFQLTERLMRETNPWLGTNGEGVLRRSPKVNGVRWEEVPFLAPFVDYVSTSQGEFLHGGVINDSITNRPMPVELLSQFVGKDNVVAYQWELTGSRVEAWLYTSQIARVVMRRAQVPHPSTMISWLEALRTHLGNCATVVTLTQPNQLSFVRRSTIGLSAADTQLFADWFESPQFPEGLHTFLAPPERLMRIKRPAPGAASHGTNAVQTVPTNAPAH